MPIRVLLPQWGMGMQEGTVLAWLKAEGDHVQENEPLVEVETEKTSETVMSPGTGTLWRIDVQEGEVAEIYEVLAVILAPGEDPPLDEGGPKESPQQLVKSESQTDPAPIAEGPKLQVEPKARKLGQELGIELDSVIGTGPGGRITVDDVRQRSGAGASSESIPLAGARALIARRMLEATQGMALLTITSDADVTELKKRRVMEQRSGKPVTSFTDVAVKTVALALRKHPYMNALLEGDSLRLMTDIHIGIAVEAQDATLVVPVVRDAADKEVAQIAADSSHLVARAREGRLSFDETDGGTFSITNLGMYSVDTFTPIVNPPQIGILGMGRIVERLVRSDHDQTWRDYMMLSLTFDHRAVDGAPAARFLDTVRTILADPTQLYG